MTIIVEDGSGINGAETYHDRAFFDDFVDAWGLGDSSGITESNYEAAARRGTLVFDSVYAVRFAGYSVSNSQSLCFPMLGLLDTRNYGLPPLPIQVKQAAAALTWYESQNPMSLLPTVTPGKAKKSVVAGPVEVVYDLTAGGAGYLAGVRPILAIVEAILGPMRGTAQGGKALYGSAGRG